jgi:hypothetical protein
MFEIQTRPISPTKYLNKLIINLLYNLKKLRKFVLKRGNYGYICIDDDKYEMIEETDKSLNTITPEYYRPTRAFLDIHFRGVNDESATSYTFHHFRVTLEKAAHHFS